MPVETRKPSRQQRNTRAHASIRKHMVKAKWQRENRAQAPTPTGSASSIARMRNPDGSRAWEKEYLRALEQGGTHTVAEKFCGIAHSTALEHRGKNSAFEQACQEALQRFRETFRTVVLTRARDGVLEPIWMKDADGNPVKVDEVRRYTNERLAQIALSGWYPQEFGKQQMDITSNGQTLSAPVVAPTQVIIQIPANGRDAMPAAQQAPAIDLPNAKQAQIPESSPSSPISQGTPGKQG